MPKPTELYGRPWSEPEYLLVLDLYFLCNDKSHREREAAVRELSSLMGRTPDAIHMRMENFSSIDPECSHIRRGLVNLAPLCKRVFEEWNPKRDHLRSLAEVYRRDAERALSNRTLFEPDPVSLPRAFGKYELLDPIGRGAFGSVFSCVDTTTGRTAALKIIHADRMGDTEALHRFAREIRVLQSIKHPNVIALREDNLDTERSFPGFVMDLAAFSLTDYSSKNLCRPERPFPHASVALEIMLAVSRACVALHSNSPRIIHRDINPNNVLQLTDGTWALADFSLAKFIDTVQFSTSFATRTEQGWGTAYYAAPEQYRDFKRTDERTDVYALGVLLWELFSASWPPPERERPGLSADLTPLFLRATERKASLRFSSAQEFLEALAATETFSRSGLSS